MGASWSLRLSSTTQCQLHSVSGLLHVLAEFLPQQALSVVCWPWAQVLLIAKYKGCCSQVALVAAIRSQGLPSHISLEEALSTCRYLLFEVVCIAVSAKANADQRAGRVLRAIQLYTRALMFSSVSPSMRVSLFTCRSGANLAMGRLGDAVADGYCALDLDSASVDALNSLAWALFHRGCFGAAVRVLTQSVDQDSVLLAEKIHALQEKARESSAMVSVDISHTIVLERSMRLASAQSSIGKSMLELMQEAAQPRERAPLYHILAQARDEMKRRATQQFMSNDRQAAWQVLRDGYRKCPLLIWYPVLDLNDIMRPSLVRFAKDVQRPISSVRRDGTFASKLLHALNVQVNDNAVQQDWTLSHRDAVEDADKPTVRWWLAYVQLDAEDWIGAKQTIDELLFDCTTELWPIHLLPEAIYLAAVAEFAGSNSRTACSDLLSGYFNVAHPLDRNQADAKLLALWAEGADSTRIQAATAELQEIRQALGDAWDHDTCIFSEHTWVRTKVSAALGLQEANPFLPLAEAVRQQWERASPAMHRMRPVDLEERLSQLVVSGGLGVVPRYQMSCDDERKQRAAR